MTNEENYGALVIESDKSPASRDASFGMIVPTKLSKSTSLAPNQGVCLTIYNILDLIHRHIVFPMLSAAFEIHTVEMAFLPKSKHFTHSSTSQGCLQIFDGLAMRSKNIIRLQNNGSLGFLHDDGIRHGQTFSREGRPKRIS